MKVFEVPAEGDEAKKNAEEKADDNEQVDNADEQPANISQEAIDADDQSDGNDSDDDDDPAATM